MPSPAGTTPGDSTVNPAPIGPMDYVGNPLNVLAPQFWGQRSEDQTQPQERGHSKVARSPSEGTKVNPPNVQHSQRERLGARRQVDKQMQGAYTQEHAELQANGRVIASSTGVHRDFSDAPTVAYK